MEKRKLAKQRVDELLRIKFNLTQEELDSFDSDSLLQDMGVDSIDVVELEMEFEKDLDCTIDESNCVKTYGQLITLYEENIIDNY